MQAPPQQSAPILVSDHGRFLTGSERRELTRRPLLAQLFMDLPQRAAYACCQLRCWKKVGGS